METKEYRTADKSEWGEGPWLTEPDKMQWQDEATGLPCLIVRNTRVTGALCGYVGVAEGHPDFEKGYDHVEVEVHGGLTFASFCTESDDESSHICHVQDRANRITCGGSDSTAPTAAILRRPWKRDIASRRLVQPSSAAAGKKHTSPSLT